MEGCRGHPHLEAREICLPTASYPLHLKVLLKRLLPMVENNRLIPRQRHSTIGHIESYG
jgi:hypothetical protein